MSGTFIKPAAIGLLVAVCFFCSTNARAQNSFEDAMAKQMDSLLHAGYAPASAVNDTKLSPNDALDGIMTPSGWGGYGTAVFGGLGGTYPELYRGNKADLIASAGFCVGDPQKAVNFAASVNMTDVHRFRDFSGNFIVSREISTGNSISAGALQEFTSAKHSDAPGATYYFAYSHAVQWALSKTPGCSALSYTLGVGNGRFLDKSPLDIKNGKGKYATAVFGSVSYEIFAHTNLNAEWFGQNLGFSVGIRPFKNPFSIGVGIANITRYTGDKANMVFGIGYPLSLSRAQ